MATPHPELKGLVDEAERRKGRQILFWELAGGLLFAVLIAAGAFSFVRTTLAVDTVKAQNVTIGRQNDAIAKQASEIQRLTQESQGRGREVLSLLNLIHDQGTTLTAVSALLVDCTTPQGKCSQAQAARAGVFIKDLKTFLAAGQQMILAAQTEELRRLGTLFQQLGIPESIIQQAVDGFPGPVGKMPGPVSTPVSGQCLLSAQSPVLTLGGTVCREAP